MSINIAIKTKNNDVIEQLNEHFKGKATFVNDDAQVIYQNNQDCFSLKINKKEYVFGNLCLVGKDKIELQRTTNNENPLILNYTSQKLLATIQENDKAELFNEIIEYANSLGVELDGFYTFNTKNGIINSAAPIFSHINNEVVFNDKFLSINGNKISIELNDLNTKENISNLQSAISLQEELLIKKAVLFDFIYNGRKEVLKELDNYYKNNPDESIPLSLNGLTKKLETDDNDIIFGSLARDNDDMFIDYLIDDSIPKNSLLPSNLYIKEIDTLIKKGVKFPTLEKYKNIINNFNIKDIENLDRNSTLYATINNTLMKNKITFLTLQNINKKEFENFTKFADVDIFNVGNSNAKKEFVNGFVYNSVKQNYNEKKDNILSYALLSQKNECNVFLDLTNENVDQKSFKALMRAIDKAIIVADENTDLDISKCYGIKRDGKIFFLICNHIDEIYSSTLSRNFDDTVKFLKNEKAFANYYLASTKAKLETNFFKVEENNKINTKKANFINNSKTASLIKALASEEFKFIFPQGALFSVKEPYDSKNTQDRNIKIINDIYVKNAFDDTNAFDVLNIKNNKIKESVSFSGGGLARNMGFPATISLKTQEHKNKMFEIIEKSLEKYLSKTDISESNQELLRNQIQNAIFNPNNKQMTIQIFNYIDLDSNRDVPLEYFVAMDHLGRTNAAIPLPASFIHETMLEEELIKLDEILKLPKITVEKQMKTLEDFSKSIKELEKIILNNSTELGTMLSKLVKKILNSKEITIEKHLELFKNQDYENFDLQETYTNLKKAIAKYVNETFLYSTEDEIMDVAKKIKASSMVVNFEHTPVAIVEKCLYEGKELVSKNLSNLKERTNEDDYKKIEEMINDFYLGQIQKPMLIDKIFANLIYANKINIVLNLIKADSILIKYMSNINQKNLLSEKTEEIKTRLANNKAILDYYEKKHAIPEFLNLTIAKNIEILKNRTAFIVNNLFNECFINKLENLNGLRNYQVSAILSSIIEKDKNLSLNYPARSGKTASSLGIALFNSSSSDFYVQNKNYNDIIRQAIQFYPEMIHKIGITKEVKFLRPDFQSKVSANDELIPNLPKLLQNFLNDEKSADGKSTKLVLEDDFFARMSYIKDYVVEKSQLELEKIFKEKQPDNEFYKLYFDLQNTFNSKDYHSIAMTTFYTNYLQKHNYLKSDDYSDIFNKLKNVYADFFVEKQKALNKPEPKLTILGKNILKREFLNIHDMKNNGSTEEKILSNSFIDFGQRDLVNDWRLVTCDAIDTSLESNPLLKSFANWRDNISFPQNSTLQKEAQLQKIVTVLKFPIKKKIKKTNEVLFEEALQKTSNMFLKELEQNIAQSFVALDEEEHNAKKYANFFIVQAGLKNNQEYANIFYDYFQNNGLSFNESFINLDECDFVKAFSFNVDDKILSVINNNVEKFNDEIYRDDSKKEKLTELIDDASKKTLNDFYNKNSLNILHTIYSDLFIPKVNRDTKQLTISRSDVLTSYGVATTNNDINFKYSVNSGSVNYPVQMSSNNKLTGAISTLSGEIFAPASKDEFGGLKEVILQKMDIHLNYNRAKHKNLLKIISTDNVVKNKPIKALDITSNTFVFTKDKERKEILIDEAHKNSSVNAKEKMFIDAKKNDQNNRATLITATPKTEFPKELSVKIINKYEILFLNALSENTNFNEVFKTLILDRSKDTFHRTFTNDQDSVLRMIAHHTNNIQEHYFNFVKSINDFSSDMQSFIDDTTVKMSLPDFINSLKIDLPILDNLAYTLVKNVAAEYSINKVMPEINFANIDFYNKYLDNSFANKLDIQISSASAMNYVAQFDNLESDEIRITKTANFDYNVETQKSNELSFIGKQIAQAFSFSSLYFSELSIRKTTQAITDAVDIFVESFTMPSISQTEKKDYENIIQRNIKELQNEIDTFGFNMKAENLIASTLNSDKDGLSNIAKDFFINGGKSTLINIDTFTPTEEKNTQQRIFEKIEIAKTVVFPKIKSIIESRYADIDFKHFGHYIKNNQEAQLYPHKKDQYSYLFDIGIDENGEKTIINIPLPTQYNINKDCQIIDSCSDVVPLVLKKETTINELKGYFEYLAPFFDENSNAKIEETITPSSRIKGGYSTLMNQEFIQTLNYQIENNKVFPIFTDRKNSLLFSTLMSLDKLASMENNREKTVLALSTDPQIIGIFNSLDKQKLLNEKNINFVLVEKTNDLQEVVNQLNLFDKDPDVMILNRKQCAEGFQIKKFTVDNDTFMLMPDGMDAMKDFATTCQVVARIDSEQTRFEHFKLNQNHELLLPVKAFGLGSESSRLISYKKTATPSYRAYLHKIQKFDGKIDYKNFDEINRFLMSYGYISNGAIPQKLKNIVDFFKGYKNSSAEKPITDNYYATLTSKSLQFIIDKEYSSKLKYNKDQTINKDEAIEVEAENIAMQGVKK